VSVSYSFFLLIYLLSINDCSILFLLLTLFSAFPFLFYIYLLI
jgi:hypothetical protein